MMVKIKTSRLGGRGLFAERDIKRGEIIEIAPVIVCPKSDLPHLDQTELYNYYFEWSGGRAAVALGYGSLFNHSYHANATYQRQFKKDQIVYRAVKNIKKGEEVLINYNGDPNCRDKVWFDQSSP